MVEYVKVCSEEMNLLLRAFGIVIEEKYCHYCGDNLELEKTCLLPSKDDTKDYVLSCSSSLCIAHYMEEDEPENVSVNKTKE